MNTIDLGSRRLLLAGKPLPEAEQVLVLIHGRGSSNDEILSLSQYLYVDDFALLAPQAPNGSWYPQSFLAPPLQNEPWLSSALDFLGEIILDLSKVGIHSERIYWLGFSQGACLTLEFAARNAQKYGGIIALTGGLIGDKLYVERYQGDFKQTKIFIGTNEPDPHVPTYRVLESVELLKKMNADVTLKVYPNLGHTTNEDEIREANAILSANKLFTSAE